MIITLFKVHKLMTSVFGEDNQYQRRDPFNKSYRLTEAADKWNESNKGEFEDFRRLAMRFFESGRKKE